MNRFVIILVLTTLAVYATSWDNAFLSDDIFGIVQNPDLGNIPAAVKTLNVTNIVYALLYLVNGPNPLLFHVTSTLFHVATIPFLYRLIYVLSTLANHTKKECMWIAQIVTVLFALHPIGVESVAWISALPYTIYPLFFTASLMTYILVDQKKIPSHFIWASLVLFILTMTTSALGVALFGVYVLYEVLFSKNIRSSLPRLLLFGIAAILFIIRLGIQYYQRVEAISISHGGNMQQVNLVKQIPESIYTYVKLSLFPIGLTHYHEATSSITREYFASVLLVIVLIGTIAIVWKTHRLISFGLSLFLISLTPTFLPVTVAWTVAERYVHVGSIGLFLAGSSVMILFARRYVDKEVIQSYKPYITSILVLTVGVMIYLTLTRIHDWHNEETFAKSTVRASPSSAYAHNNMGVWYMKQGMEKEALTEFSKALDIQPTNADVLNNMAYLYLKSGDVETAQKLYTQAVTVDPTLYQSYIQLGNIEMMNDHFKEAEPYFRKSLKYNKDPFYEHITLYAIYTKLENKTKADEHFLLAKRLVGHDENRKAYVQKIQNNLGISSDK